VIPYDDVEPSCMRSHTLQLLSTVLDADPINQSILEVDAFGILLSMTFSLPSLFNCDNNFCPYPSGNVQVCAFQLIYYVYFYSTEKYNLIGLTHSSANLLAPHRSNHFDQRSG